MITHEMLHVIGIGSLWSEFVFLSELMTGWANRGKNPLSRVTIGSLSDMGYTVNMAAMDSYVFPGGFLRSGNGLLASPKKDWERPITIKVRTR